VEVDRRRAAFRIAVAAVVAAVLLTSVGWERVLGNLRTADLRLWLLAPVAAALALVVGGEGTRLALGVPARSLRASLARRAFYGGSIVRNFLPAGNVGAGGFVAYVVSRHPAVSASAAVAGVTGWEFLVMVASAVVGGAGVAGLAAAHGSTTAVAVDLVIGFTTLLAASVVLVAALSRFRDRIAAGVARLSSALDPHLSGTVPGYDGPVASGDARRGIDDFFGALRSLASDRARFGLVLLVACGVWLCWALPLYVSLYAVGAAVSPLAVLVAVPVSGFGRAVPIPAGIGPVDAVLGSVLLSVTAQGVGDVASALVLYRAAMLLAQATVGGGALWSLEGVMTGGGGKESFPKDSGD